MMLLEAIGLAVGLLLGWLCPWTVPADWTVYVATGLLAALDSALGGFRARIAGEFKLDMFLSGTIGNTVIIRRKPSRVDALCAAMGPTSLVLPVKPMRSSPMPVKNTDTPDAALTTKVCIEKMTLSSRRPVFS